MKVSAALRDLQEMRAERVALKARIKQGEADLADSLAEMACLDCRRRGENPDDYRTLEDVPYLIVSDGCIISAFSYYGDDEGGYVHQKDLSDNHFCIDPLVRVVDLSSV